MRFRQMAISARNGPRRPAASLSTSRSSRSADCSKASARIALANVPRQVFSASAVQALGAAAQIEAGAIELTLRDLGSVDLGVVQYARAQNVSRDAARKAIVENIMASSKDVASANPDAEAAVQALARFVESPGQTLVIKLTPLGKVQAMQLFRLLKTEPLIALGQFRIEASTGFGLSSTASRPSHGEEREARLRTMLRIAGRTMRPHLWPTSFETQASPAAQDEGVEQR